MQSSTIHSTSELAARLGLSRWTVSRALNRHPEVSTETAEKVWAEAKRLGFAPSILGRGLRRGRTDLVGVIVPDLEDYYLTNKVSILRDGIEAAGFQGIFQITNVAAESERAAFERLSAMRCTGIISMASRLETHDTVVEGLLASGTRVVTIDPFSGSGQLVVATDRTYALRETVSHLARQGHRSFAIFGIDITTPYGQQRLRGLKAGCKAGGLDFVRAMKFLTVPDETISDFEAGRLLARNFIAHQHAATAIIALNDQIALGAMQILDENGLRIPEDISIIGYDDADFAAYTTPALTSVSSQASSLIKQAMNLLLGERPPGSKVVVRPKIIVRASTGPCRVS